MPTLEINMCYFKKQLGFRVGAFFFPDLTCLLAFTDTRAGPEGFEYRYLWSNRIHLTEVPLISAMVDLSLRFLIHCQIMYTVVRCL